jgi:hypothetical protein
MISKAKSGEGHLLFEIMRDVFEIMRGRRAGGAKARPASADACELEDGMPIGLGDEGFDR